MSLAVDPQNVLESSHVILNNLNRVLEVLKKSSSKLHIHEILTTNSREMLREMFM